MHIRFANLDQQFIQQAVAAGDYSNETELVRDAVRRLREIKSQSLFFNAVMAGNIEINEGKARRYTAKTMEKIKKNAAAKVKTGKAFNSNYAIP